MEIRTPSEKLRFSHNYKDHNKKIKEILTGLVGPTLTYKAPMLQWSINIGGSKDDIA